MTPEQVATYGGGVVALALILWFVRASLANTIRRQDANAAGEESLTTRLQRQLDDMHQRNSTLNDRMHEMMRESIALATTHGAKLMEAVQQVRIEHHDAIARVHGKLEATEAILRDCNEQHQDCAVRLAALEEKVG